MILFRKILMIVVNLLQNIWQKFIVEKNIITIWIFVPSFAEGNLDILIGDGTHTLEIMNKSTPFSYAKEIISTENNFLTVSVYFFVDFMD